MPTVKVESEGQLRQAMTIGRHHLLVDEPIERGGGDEGPSPYDLLLAALGACTSSTVKMYALRKGWALERVEVELTQERDEQGVHVMKRAITLVGELSPEQRERLFDIALRCPMHRTLDGPIRIDSELIV